MRTFILFEYDAECSTVEELSQHVAAEFSVPEASISLTQLIASNGSSLEPGCAPVAVRINDRRFGIGFFSQLLSDVVHLKAELSKTQDALITLATTAKSGSLSEAFQPEPSPAESGKALLEDEMLSAEAQLNQTTADLPADPKVAASIFARAVQQAEASKARIRMLQAELEEARQEALHGEEFRRSVVSAMRDLRGGLAGVIDEVAKRPPALPKPTRHSSSRAANHPEPSKGSAAEDASSSSDDPKDYAQTGWVDAANSESAPDDSEEDPFGGRRSALPEGFLPPSFEDEDPDEALAAEYAESDEDGAAPSSSHSNAAT